MPLTSRRTPVDADADALWAWHRAPGTFERLVPPWQDVAVTSFPEDWRVGAAARLRVRIGPTTWHWDAEFTEVDPPHGFTDEARGGPFARWEHRHVFGDGVLEDRVSWALPWWAAVGTPIARAQAEALFTWRHRITREDLARRAAWRTTPRRIGITGASGLVGTALSSALRHAGHTVVPFTRREGRPGTIRWDPARGHLNPDDLSDLDAVVHLAGEPIAGGRWTAERKRRIHDSRADGTRLVAEAMVASGGPRVLVSASAVGIYGHDRDERVDEDSASGEGFLAEVGRAWEAAADPVREAGLRVVHPRIGIVLSGHGGFLEPQVPLFRWGLGGVVGSGRQGVSWIALDDLVDVLGNALFDERYTGPINAVSPTPADNREVTKALGRVLRRPTLARVPAPAIRLLLGELGEALILGGQKVEPARLRALGYTWRRATLDDALGMELGRPTP